MCKEDGTYDRATVEGMISTVAIANQAFSKTAEPWDADPSQPEMERAFEGDEAVACAMAISLGEAAGERAAAAMERGGAAGERELALVAAQYARGLSLLAEIDSTDFVFTKSLVWCLAVAGSMRSKLATPNDGLAHVDGPSAQLGGAERDDFVMKICSSPLAPKEAARQAADNEAAMDLGALKEAYGYATHLAVASMDQSLFDKRLAIGARKPKDAASMAPEEAEEVARVEACMPIEAMRDLGAMGWLSHRQNEELWESFQAAKDGDACGKANPLGLKTPEGVLAFYDRGFAYVAASDCRSEAATTSGGKTLRRALREEAVAALARVEPGPTLLARFGQEADWPSSSGFGPRARKAEGVEGAARETARSSSSM